MKFHAEIENTLRMKDFALLISTLKSFDEKLYLKLSPDYILLFVPESSKTDSYVAFRVSSEFFDKYVLHGVDRDTEEGNFIYIEALSCNMAAAFSSFQKSNVKQAKINLVNNKFPSLSVSLKLVSEETAEIMDVVNEVPVLVIPKEHWHLYKPLQVSGYTICSSLPKFKTFRKYIDSHKGMSKRINLAFKHNENLMITARNENASVCSTFKNIKCQKFGEIDEDSCDVLAVLDSKKLASLLHFNQFTSVKMKCYVKPGGPLNFLFKVNEFISASILTSVMIPDDADDDDE